MCGKKIDIFTENDAIKAVDLLLSDTIGVKKYLSLHLRTINHFIESKDPIVIKKKRIGHYLPDISEFKAKNNPNEANSNDSDKEEKIFFITERNHILEESNMMLGSAKRKCKSPSQFLKSRTPRLSTAITSSRTALTTASKHSKRIKRVIH